MRELVGTESLLLVPFNVDDDSNFGRMLASSGSAGRRTAQEKENNKNEPTTTERKVIAS